MKLTDRYPSLFVIDCKILHPQKTGARKRASTRVESAVSEAVAGVIAALLCFPEKLTEEECAALKAIDKRLCAPPAKGGE